MTVALLTHPSLRVFEIYLPFRREEYKELRTLTPVTRVLCHCCCVVELYFYPEDKVIVLYFQYSPFPIALDLCL